MADIYHAGGEAGHRAGQEPDISGPAGAWGEEPGPEGVTRPTRSEKDPDLPSAAWPLQEGDVIPRVELRNAQLDAETARLVPVEICRQHRILPLTRGEGFLTLAMANPLDQQAVEDTRLLTGLDVIPVMASAEEIDHSLQHYAGLVSDPRREKLLEEIGRMTPGSGVVVEEEWDFDREGDAPVIRLVNSLLSQAVQEQASDIHIEPQEDGIRVRCRIDGEMVETMLLPRRVHGALSSRIKLMGQMDIAQKRVPQDGRTAMCIAGRDIDFRISTIPTIYGEKLVLRILDRTQALLDLDRLDFSPENRDAISRLLARPHGMVLVTGTTGSGKTTTLYALLGGLNTPHRNIVTLEDPVEYSLPGINQIPIRAGAGLTFASGLRSVLRQDPDIIMVGEMRDLETARLGIKAALTGHLLFSTLHTNHAVGSITRLVDMGVEPFLLAASLAGIITQRLVRRLCACRESYPLPPGLAGQMGRPELAGLSFYRPRGCNLCRRTGYRGRIALQEVLAVSPLLRDLINQSKQRGEEEMLQAALAGGMRTMVRDGMEKARTGFTSLEEMMRAVYLEG